MLYILTLNWNGKERLQTLKESLFLELTNIDFKWLIKDNGSIDGSVPLIKSWENENVQLVECNHNRDNYSQGMNLLFKEANPKNTDLILTLNNDVLFYGKNRSIKNMIKLFNDKSVGLVGSKLNYNGTNRIQHSGVLFHYSHGLPFHYRSGKIEESYDTKNREYPIVTGAISLTTADIFQNVFTKNKSGINGFNEGYNWAFDDCDFSMRIKYNLNKKVVMCGETSIYHEESASLKKNPVNKLFMSHNANLFLENWNKYLDRHLIGKYEKQSNYGLYK